MINLHHSLLDKYERLDLKALGIFLRWMYHPSNRMMNANKQKVQLTFPQSLHEFDLMICVDKEKLHALLEKQLKQAL